MERDDLKPAFREMIENDRIILGLMSSSKKIHVSKFKELCRRQFVLLDEIGSEGVEIVLPPNVHQTYNHVPQRIKDNNSEGLKKYSEENLEAMHKLAKRYRETLARKTTNEDNMKDVLRRLNFRSDPVISTFDEKTSRCSRCGEIGHIKRRCEIQPTGLEAKMATYIKGVRREEENVSTEEESETSSDSSSDHDYDL